jgi:NAD(P)-dependent dehydrogenase (short-subunit alcohol dehydrogenase family)
MSQLSSNSVFLVSGGARGVTAQCVVNLARTYGCRFILLGRSPLTTEPDWAQGCFNEAELKKRAMQALIAQGEKPTPIGIQKLFNQITSQREIRHTLSELATAGSIAEYVSVDITSPDLAQAIAEAERKTGPITGVIHGAGNLADKLIEKKTDRDFETVYSAKIAGLENLLRSVAPSQLQHLVLFSSVAGFYGNAGQADYALANEILNKSAHLFKRQYPNCHVVAVNWGPWDSGMVTPELKKIFAQRNIAVIPLHVGAQMLTNELGKTASQPAQIIIGSPITPTAVPLTAPPSSYRIRRQLDPSANPFLQDYLAGDGPALPATVAASWLINACEQRYPGYSFRKLEEFRVLEGIVFDSSLFDRSHPQPFVVDVQEVKKQNGEIVSEVLVWSELHPGQVDMHYRGLVTIASSNEADRAVPTYTTFDLRATQPCSGADLYQTSLFQGPSFQGIMQVLNLSSERVTLQCVAPKLSAVQQGQFGVETFDPYSADTVCQAVAVWIQQFHQGMGLAAEFQVIEQYQALASGERYYLSVEIRSATTSHVVADAIAHDANGAVYFHMAGIKLAMTQQLDRVFASSVGYIQ